MAYIGKSPSTGIRNRFIYTATAGQTTFSGSDDHSRTLNYNDAEFTDVFLNGVKLDKSDYTATSGTSIVLDEAAAVDDIVEVLAFDTFSVFSGEFSQDVTVGGTLTVDTDTLHVDSTNDRVGVGTNSPSTIFHVQSSDTADTISRIENTVGYAANLNLKATGNYSFTTYEGGTKTWLAGQRGLSGGLYSIYDVDNTAHRLVIDASGNVGIGTNSIHDFGVNNTGLQLNGVKGGAVQFSRGTNGATEQWALRTSDDDALRFEYGSNYATERMRIHSDGNINFNSTNKSLAVQNSDLGHAFSTTGRIYTTASGHHDFNITSDGEVVRFRSATAQEGSISISGSTVSYNGFTGSHWTRLSDNSKPTILRGTLLESIGTMMDWYQAEFDITTQDDDGNDVVTTHKVSCAKPANKNVGDTFDFVLAADNDENLPAGTYSATLLQEADIKHVKAKVSDTSESKAVYGVFSHWDSADGVNDMYVASVGTSVVRILSTETVAIGDLLDSNGDGTAKVQSDDIIRSRTIGKVLSTVKQETYSDGSYTVPCALYCG